jgi:uncharacterized protein (DUF2342 family)
VQFTAVPWLRDHLIGAARHLAVDLAPDPDAVHELAKQVAQRLPQAFAEGGAGLADLFTTPEQREQMARLTAIMSLLEGHADVVMDDVRSRAHRASPRSGPSSPSAARAGALDKILPPAARP